MFALVCTVPQQDMPRHPINPKLYETTHEDKSKSHRHETSLFWIKVTTRSEGGLKSSDFYDTTTRYLFEMEVIQVINFLLTNILTLH